MIESTQRLSDYLAMLGPAAVAVSGGVDSMTLAVLAHRVNPEIEMFHAVSPAVPVQATTRVYAYAKAEGWQLKVIDAGEIEDPEYLANPANRCYFCKTNLYATIVENTESLVMSGTNLDDLGDYRPGLSAAKEHQVCHPYVDCKISKPMLRDIARELELLDLHDLPAAPCLSSRIETGIKIDPNVLPVINDVEQTLWQSLDLLVSIKGVRCRVRAGGVVIELETAETIDEQAEFCQLTKAVTTAKFEAAGFKELLGFVKIEPYRRGSAFLIETLVLE